MAHIQKGHGVAFADLDHDGDQDIYAVMGGIYAGDNFHNALFENPNNENAWITLDLEGRITNRSAIGSRIKITTVEKSGASKNYYSTVSTGGSFGASSLRQEMGLGQAISISQIQITWANKNQTTQIFKDVSIKKAYKVIEGENDLIPLKYDAFKLIPNEHAHHNH